MSDNENPIAETVQETESAQDAISQENDNHEQIIDSHGGQKLDQKEAVEQDTTAKKELSAGEKEQKAASRLAFENRQQERKLKENEEKIRELESKTQSSQTQGAFSTNSDNFYSTDENFQRAVEQVAREKIARQSFDNQCNATFETGQKNFSNFNDSLNNLAKAGFIGQENQATYNNIQAVLATDNPEKVLHELGQNLNELDRIQSLPPYKQVIELQKIASRQDETPKRAISSTPAPAPALSGSALNNNTDPIDSDSDDDWFKKRKTQKGW